MSAEKGAINADAFPGHEQRLLNLRDQLSFLSSNDESGQPNAPDEFMQAFYQRFYTALFVEDSPNTHAAIKEVWQRQPEMSPVNFANASMRVAQDFKLRTQYPEYPKGHEDPEAWNDFFESLESKPDSRWNYQLRLYFNVQSNIANRGQSPKVLALLDGYESVSLLDIGCSRQKVLGKLALEDGAGFRYGYAEVMQRTEDSSAPTRDIAKTMALNRLRREIRLPLEYGTGIDRWDLRESIMRVWAKSCSFYPSELLKERQRVHEFDFLENNWPAQVGFHCDDFAYFDHDQFLKRFPDRQKYDLVLFSTILYQLSPQQIQQMLANAYRYVKEDGWVVIQDFVDGIQPDGTIDFAEKWKKWSYGLWARRMSDDTAEFKKYITLDGGRAKQWIFEPAAGELALARKFGLTPSAS